MAFARSVPQPWVGNRPVPQVLPEVPQVPQGLPEVLPEVLLEQQHRRRGEARVQFFRVPQSVCW